MLRKQLYPSSLTTCFWQRTHFVLIEKRITCAAFEQEPLASRPNRRPCISFSMISLFIKSFRKLAGLLGRERKKTSDNQTDRPGSERKGGEISDERALHILRYRSIQTANHTSQEPLSAALCLPFTCCQTDDTMWREGSQPGTQRDNRLLDSRLVLTLGLASLPGLTAVWKNGWCYKHLRYTSSLNFLKVLLIPLKMGFQNMYLQRGDTCA